MLPATGWSPTAPTSCAWASAPAVVQVAVNEADRMPGALTVSVARTVSPSSGSGPGQADAAAHGHFRHQPIASQRQQRAPLARGDRATGQPAVALGFDRLRSARSRRPAVDTAAAASSQVGGRRTVAGGVSAELLRRAASAYVPTVWIGGTSRAHEASSESSACGSATNSCTSVEPQTVSPSPTTWVELASSMKRAWPPTSASTLGTPAAGVHVSSSPPSTSTGSVAGEQRQASRRRRLRDRRLGPVQTGGVRLGVLVLGEPLGRAERAERAPPAGRPRRPPARSARTDGRRRSCRTAADSPGRRPRGTARPSIRATGTPK